MSKHLITFGLAVNMPVHEARQDLPLELDHVYVIPPGHFLEVEHGALLAVSVKVVTARNL